MIDLHCHLLPGIDDGPETLEEALALAARAVQLLERGWVTVLASDAHNLEHRPPELEPGRRAAAAIVGEAESWRLVRERPAAITVGNPALGEGG